MEAGKLEIGFEFACVDEIGSEGELAADWRRGAFQC